MTDTMKIIKRLRPLIEATDRDLNQLIINAHIMAEGVNRPGLAESMAASVIKITAINMINGATEEIANRN